MNEILKDLFGEGRNLSELQMGCRAFVMFFITLLLIRIAGMRAFGQKSAFDTIIVIMLGAILSRAVTGVSPFLPTVTAGFVLSVTHRILAMLTVYHSVFGNWIKGSKRLLYADGKFFRTNMFLCSISKNDLAEELRLALHTEDFSSVKEIFMERSGKISIIVKQQ